MPRQSPGGGDMSGVVPRSSLAIVSRGPGAGHLPCLAYAVQPAEDLVRLASPVSSGLQQPQWNRGRHVTVPRINDPRCVSPGEMELGFGIVL